MQQANLELLDLGMYCNLRPLGCLGFSNKVTLQWHPPLPCCHIDVRMKFLLQESPSHQMQGVYEAIRAVGTIKVGWPDFHLTDLLEATFVSLPPTWSYMDDTGCV